MGAGGVQDLTGTHQLKTIGGVQSATVDVDTSIAVPNPGATLSLSVSVTPQGQDQLTGLEISGLLPGTTLRDSGGNAGTGARHDILGWDYQNLTAKLTAGVAENMRIRVVATVTGPLGDDAVADSEQVLVLDPSKPVP